MRYSDRVDIFRSRIQEVIHDSGLNHSAFASSIGVDRSTLSQLLSNKGLRLPRADTVAAIGEEYNVSVDWLLGLTQQGKSGTDILDGPPEYEDFSNESFNSKWMEWHEEARNYKVRYIPSTIPDLLKTEAVATYEFSRYGLGRTGQSIRKTHQLLVQQRSFHSEMETCMSLHELMSFINGEGVWCDLSRQIRKDQVEHMITLVDELYPRFRWFMFNGRQFYTSAFTVYGPFRVVVFIGKFYLVLNSTQQNRIFSDRFDQLVKQSIVQPNEVVKLLKNKYLTI